MKISADSGLIEKSHPTVSDIVFQGLKEIRLMLYPCMPLDSCTLDKICLIIRCIYLFIITVRKA